jgi:hypothetical protein
LEGQSLPGLPRVLLLPLPLLPPLSLPRHLLLPVPPLLPPHRPETP